MIMSVCQSGPSIAWTGPPTSGPRKRKTAVPQNPPVQPVQANYVSAIQRTSSALCLYSEGNVFCPDRLVHTPRLPRSLAVFCPTPPWTTPVGGPSNPEVAEW